MPIQLINLGTAPNGAGGDSLRSTATKINTNFTDQTNVAARQLGVATGQIPLAEDTFRASYSRYDAYIGSAVTSPRPNCNDFIIGSRNFVSSANVDNTPPVASATHWLITTQIVYTSAHREQFAIGYNSTEYFSRSMNNNVWTAWTPVGQTKTTYTTTTALGANVVVDANGFLMRSTSSERYKNILDSLTLDDEAYNNAMQLVPIIYRSTAEADNPNHHYYSFSAEAIGAYDKAFTFWRDTEIVKDAEGIETEVALDQPIAEGLNINSLLAFSHAISIKQAKIIDALEARIEALEALKDNTAPIIPVETVEAPVETVEAPVETVEAPVDGE